jgi:hypothetical protein
MHGLRRAASIGIAALLASAPTVASGAAHLRGGEPLVLEIKSQVVYKHDAHFTVTLVPAEDVTNLEVSVYAKPKQQPQTLVMRADVDPTTGILEGDIDNLKRETTVRAVWNGDAAAGYPDTYEAKTVVEVKVDLRAHMTKFDGKDGKYYLYESGKKVFIKVTVSPAKAGETITFRYDRLVQGDWELLGHAKVPITHGGVTAYLAPSNLDAGTRYRIKAKHDGDDDLFLIGDQTPYLYFKVE